MIVRICTVILTLATIAAALVAAPALAEIQPGIHVNGRGSLEVEPDMGRVQLHVRREGLEAGALQAQLDDVVKKVLTLAKRLGIDEQDITATAVSIHPRYQRRANQQVLEGLTASRSLSITLRDLDSFGPLLTQALAAGVNTADPIVLDTSKRAELEDQALDLAIADARREAERVATGFGVTLGVLEDAQVGSHAARPTMAVERLAGFAAADGGSPFQPGLIVVERWVSATFAIIP